MAEKSYQKFKPYIVLQYLLKRTDNNHVATAPEIVAYLEEHGIHAERRGIYRDIQEINAVYLMLEEDCLIEEAEAMLVEDESGESKLIAYDPHRKGFFVQRRLFDLADIRMIAESIYAAKYISTGGRNAIK